MIKKWLVSREFISNFAITLATLCVLSPKQREKYEDAMDIESTVVVKELNV